MPDYHIAVLDIGKTNKKILIFDPNLNIRDSVYKTFDEYIENNIHYENTEQTIQWFKTELKKYSTIYHIKVISITTHGATFACIDTEGNTALPVIAYTTEPGQEFHDEFFKKFGNRQVLQEKTATAELGALINPGISIYFIKKKFPEKFDTIKYILFFPQFFGYILTGKIGAEPTYTGCHNYLWDFKNNQWSFVAEKLGIIDKLPAKLSRPWDILGTITPEIAQQTGLPADTIVTMGIHDSNSSLLPYIIKTEKNFVLNSTGTWCVAMHPADKIEFQPDELGKVVFYNLSAFGQPVKTAIFMGGMEFDTYTDILTKISRKQECPAFDQKLYQKIIQEKKLYILPGVIKGTGQFPDSQPRVIENNKIYELADIKTRTNLPHFFRDFNTAYAVLNISLAIQTKIALDRTELKGKEKIFIEGGFRKNQAYNALLTCLYPESEIFLTNLNEATAFGAAILGKCAFEKKDPYDIKDLFDIEFKQVPSEKLQGFDAYIDSFHKLLTN